MQNRSAGIKSCLEVPGVNGVEGSAPAQHAPQGFAWLLRARQWPCARSELFQIKVHVEVYGGLML